MIFFLLLAKAVFTVAATSAVVAAVVAITYSAVKDWYEPLLLPGFDVEMFKKELANATHVNVGIRNSYGTLVHQKSFEGEMADDMKAKFAGHNRIVLKG